MSYTIKEIEDFTKSANRDLGNPKYKPNDLIADYARAIIIIQQLLAEIKENKK